MSDDQGFSTHNQSTAQSSLTAAITDDCLTLANNASEFFELVDFAHSQARLAHSPAFIPPAKRQKQSHPVQDSRFFANFSIYNAREDGRVGDALSGANRPTRIPREPVQQQIQPITKGLTASSLFQEGVPPIVNNPPDGEAEPEDEDEIWKKFIFDDEDITEITRNARETAQRSICEQLSSSVPLYEIASPSFTNDQLRILNQPLAQLTASDMTLSPTPANNTTHYPEDGADFRFHQPRPFVGRLASNNDKNTQEVPEPKRRGRGRPKRKRDGSRPDIRKLPNYDGGDDIIEED